MITVGRSSLCKGLCGESSSGGLLRRIYSRTPSYTNKCRGKRLYSAFRPSALVGPTLQQALSGAVRTFGSRRFSCRNSCKETKVRKRNRIHGGRKSLYNTEGWIQCPQREMCFSPISPVGKRAGQSRQFCRRSRAERFAPLRRIYRRSQQPTPARLRPPTSAWHTGRPA